MTESLHKLFVHLFKTGITSSLGLAFRVESLKLASWCRNLLLILLTSVRSIIRRVGIVVDIAIEYSAILISNSNFATKISGPILGFFFPFLDHLDASLSNLVALFSYMTIRRGRTINLLFHLLGMLLLFSRYS